MSRSFRNAVSLLLLLASDGVFELSRAEACSCRTRGPACESFWTTTAVFDGTVVSIEPVSREEHIGDKPIRLTAHLVKLDVRQSWKGVDRPTIEVVTNSDEASCGFEFKVGRRYLVFAEGGTIDTRLRVSICGSTHEYDGTGEAADFLNSLTLPSKGGRVFGKIELSARSFKPDDGVLNRMPFEVPVRLTGNGRALKTTTTDGRYEFPGLFPGMYEIGITLPAGYSTWRTEREAEIRDVRSCVEANFGINPDGHITGRLVDRNGRGVPRVSVEVAAYDSAIYPPYGLVSGSPSSDSNGYFDVGALPPGHYIAGINLRDLPSEWNPYPRIVYPGGDDPPHTIELTLGQVVDLGQWVLPPPLAVVEVRGLVTWQDGTPATGVYVSATDVTGNPVERARGAGGATAGGDGRFVLKLREGREYTFVARIGSGPLLPVSRVRIKATSDIQPLRLVIEANPK